MLNKPKKLNVRLIDKYFLTENGKYMLAKFELLEDNNTIDFDAGQYVSLRINEAGERRSYSIVSTPDIDHAVSLVVEMIPGGKGSEYLKNLKIGSDAEMIAPLGQFVVTKENGSKNLLFVATGSGIAPIYSMINDELINKNNNKLIRLHWGMRNEEDLLWLDNLTRLAEAHNNFVFDVVLSSPSSNWQLCQGHVQDCLQRDMAKVDLEEWDSYICGSPKMVDEVSSQLEKIGAPTPSIHFERYS